MNGYEDDNRIKVVQNRVDALTVAARVYLDSALVEHLKTRGVVARKHGRADVRFGEIVGEMKWGRTPRQWNVTGRYFRVRIDERGTGATVTDPGWTLEIVWSADALASFGLPDVLKWSQKIAESCGQIGKTEDAVRLRRIDLCADVAGYQVRASDRDRLVLRSRAMATVYEDVPRMKRTRGASAYRLSQKPRVKNYGSPGTAPCSGIAICQGNPLSGRIYDKPRELAKKQDADAFDAEKRRWKSKGWDGEAPVTRVEFQIRGEAVRDLGLRNLHAPRDPLSGRKFASLLEVVDRVWQRCLSWCRLVVRGSSMRLSRCTNDRVWDELHEVTFYVSDPPAAHGRKRERGKVTAEQLLGCALGMLGGAGMLRRMDPTMPDSGDGIADVIERRIVSWFEACGVIVAARLVEKWGPREAAVHLAECNNAVMARFAPPPRHMQRCGCDVRPGRPASLERAVA